MEKGAFPAGWMLLGIGSLVVLAMVIRKFRRHQQVPWSVFDSPDAPGSGACLDPRLLDLLKKLARETGYPIFEWINSGVRTPAWNQQVGGVANSAHLTDRCMAVDIGVPNPAVRDSLVKAAKKVGFTRIGVAQTFVHLDVDASKRQYVAWGYPQGTPPPLNPFG